MEKGFLRRHQKFLVFIAFVISLVFTSGWTNAKATTYLVGNASVNGTWQPIVKVPENQVLTLGTPDAPTGSDLERFYLYFVTDSTSSEDLSNLYGANDAQTGIAYAARFSNNSSIVGLQEAYVHTSEIAGALNQQLSEVGIVNGISSPYDIYYRVELQSIGWLGWAKNGAPNGTAGNDPIEAIQIIFVKKGVQPSITIDPNQNTDLKKIVYSIDYTSGTNPNPRAFSFFAVNENNRGAGDGFYSTPYGTSVDITPNTNALPYHKMIGFSDRQVMLNDGTSWTHINFYSTWHWIDTNALSWDKTTGVHPIETNNCYNTSGQIIYASDSMYSKELDEAATFWNDMLGTFAFVKGNSMSASNLTLKVSDFDTDSRNFLMETSCDFGTIIVNTAYIKEAFPNSNLYDTKEIIRNMFIHELGHTMGLGHTGGYNLSWSWSDDSDIMWNSTSTSQSQNLTANDLAAANLIRSLHLFYGTSHPNA